MKDWFDNLEQREQWFVGAGAVIAAIVILWGLVWMPLANGHDNARTDVDTWEGALAELRVVGASMTTTPTTGPTPQPGSTDSPVIIVDQTLRAANLNSSLQRRQPTPNGIRVEFEDVAFDQLIVWLGDLNNRYAMEVQAGNMNISTRTGPGRINASFTLERAP